MPIHMQPTATQRKTSVSWLVAHCLEPICSAHMLQGHLLYPKGHCAVLRKRLLVMLGAAPSRRAGHSR